MWRPRVPLIKITESSTDELQTEEEEGDGGREGEDGGGKEEAIERKKMKEWYKWIDKDRERHREHIATVSIQYIC